MKLSAVLLESRYYFNGFQEISNWKANSSKINALALVKILSYFTVVLPLIFSAIYSISLCGRVYPKVARRGEAPTVLPNFKFCRLDFEIKARKELSGDSLSYAQNVFMSQLYQDNPCRYLADWGRERGLTEEYRGPEGDALRFFKHVLLERVL